MAVERIPVPLALDASLQSKINKLVDIVQFKAEQKLSNELEKQEISKLIYSLFKLTQTEIDILERRIASYFK